MADLAKNDLGYHSQMPCGDSVSDWCSGAEYASWRRAAIAMVPDLPALGKAGPAQFGVIALALVAEFQLFPHRGGTIWEYPSTIPGQPTTKQLANLVQRMEDLLNNAGVALPTHTKRNKDISIPEEGNLPLIGWGIAAAVVLLGGGYVYYQMRK